MSCGCKTSGDSSHSCGTKSSNGCDSVDTCGNSYKLSVFDWLSDIRSPSMSNNDWVEVRFKNERKCFFKNVNSLPLHIGSVVTVESSPGHDVGVVSLTGELVNIQMKKKHHPENEILKIYRLATQRDIEIWQGLREKEEEIKIKARKISYSLQLEMKISDVEFQGDGAKLTFYYTADNRVDFRVLIKEFAGTFRTKIDMKQIGYRQEAAKLGGIGSCGRELCCSTWLTDFRSVNTNAARYQQLSINPQKLAGQCGKLKCCLNYELDSYLDTLSHFPSSNTTLDTENGKAFCIKIDVFKRKMWFAYSDKAMAWYDLHIDDVKELMAMNKAGKKATPLEEVRVMTEVKEKAVDIIQENNMDRFEKKNPSKNRNNRNKNSKPQNNNPQNNSQQSAKPQQNNSPQNKVAPNNSAENKEISTEPNTNKPKKKFKKKYPPKPNNNAQS
ncbi:PSP1 domain-containing protein [Halpernia frigidisoli]|uniref:Cell fate regulator YaaT, PSP1 superfamily (Controls sporulation, competence, biofilm development) n=1 Tax=Halpernia frigidisoli TaxID=1125876 RepID=A0A1I3HNR5_9FLAO|nr:regulatory iron-sulfur-containing complex subunit RicT [Halpernia frigidisoli]SFI37375.1 Cell fate regulator YaaT, PSP1 superfamily (controls sporulation, competence, biofilm development) [Halpernia frigidisoli]